MFARTGRFALFLCTAAAWAADPGPELFNKQVRPLLEKSCFPCHGGLFKKSGLDLSTRESLMRGGDSGPVVVEGSASQSLLLKLISHRQEPAMPYKSPKLPDDAIARIAEWIDAGAPYTAPLQKAAVAVPVQPHPGGDHWAFRRPQRPPVPHPANAKWVRNPVDAFIAAEHQKRGLQPSPPAEKPVLLRRLYLTLTGLPPTPEELHSFLSDRSPDAYEKVVERLLASPAYGERWARHWMDIWRYSDWYGWRAKDEVRYSQRHIWRWRDWIVESLNRDKAYDQMIVQMLAGDELAPGDPDTLRATGYLARNWQQNRTEMLRDAVDHTAAAFLGITLRCARCHDHKYDPFSQQEYYQFQAFFQPYAVRTDRVPGQADVKKDGLARTYDGNPADKTYRLVLGDGMKADKSQALTPGVPEVLGHIPAEWHPVSLPKESAYPDLRPFVTRDLIADAKAAIETAEAKLRKARDENKPLELPEKELLTAQAFLPALEARLAADLAKAGLSKDADLKKLAAAALNAETIYSFHKAQEHLARSRTLTASLNSKFDPDDKDGAKLLKDIRAEVTAANKALEAKTAYTPVGKSYALESTGRRSALAHWIASTQNPLTARVAINHIWLRHFGAALVPTVSNFGVGGKPPSHPELLDWLAVELMDNGWSMKSIHRLIVTSNTFRMQSHVGEYASANLRADRDNVYLWRMNVRRMEAEVVRDSVLRLAGRLDPVMGGPDLEESAWDTSRRRSIYLRHNPDTELVFLKLFDKANPIECYERFESIIPQQALAMSNSKLLFDNSMVLADRLADQKRDADFIRGAFESVLGRLPSTEEQAEAAAFLAEQTRLSSRGRANLVLALLNHNDFVTVR